MNVDEVMSYVMKTPENSNPNVLRPMLEQLSAANGGSTGGDQYCEVLELSPTDFRPYNPDSETEPEYFLIYLTEEATNRLMNIFDKGKTPIIKLEDTIYNPTKLTGAPFEFINYFNNTELVIFPYGYSNVHM